MNPVLAENILKLNVHFLDSLNYMKNLRFYVFRITSQSNTIEEFIQNHHIQIYIQIKSIFRISAKIHSL